MGVRSEGERRAGDASAAYYASTVYYATDCIDRTEQTSLHSRSSVNEEGKVGNECMKRIEAKGNPRMESSGLETILSAPAFYHGHQVYVIPTSRNKQ